MISEGWYHRCCPTFLGKPHEPDCPRLQTKDVFWLVWCPERGLPHMKHATQAEAIAEADRLAKAEPFLAFYVLRLIGFSKAEPQSFYRPIR